MHRRLRPVFALQLFIMGACGGSAPVAPVPSPVPAVEKPAIIAPVRLAPVAELIGAEPTAVGMDAALNTRIDSIVEVAIREGAAPGAAVAIGRYGRLVHLKGYGFVDYTPGAPAVTPGTLFDLASLTKVVATTTIAMMLEEQGRLDLTRPVSFYVPEFGAPDKAAVTVGMLLTHTGGLEAYAPLYLQHRGRAAYLAQINTRPLKSAPGSAMVYSDWDMVLMQAVIERITGLSLDRVAADWIFQPLGMHDTRFLPDTSDTALRARIATTAVDTARGGPLQGTVHDGNAWAIGGVSGHAGLFSSARELATFSQLLLDGGTYATRRLLSPATITRWTTRQTAAWSRALGWDTPAVSSSAGRYFSPRSFGHTGFTGTSIWIDPERGLFVVLLTNRVNTRGTSTRHVQLRRDVADAAQASILDAPLVEWELMLRSP